MTEAPEAADELEARGGAALGTGALVFVGGMALAAASFLAEHYIIKTLKKA